jgi:hypothetical protein
LKGLLDELLMDRILPTAPPVPALRSSLFSCSFQLLEFKSKLRLWLTV